MEIEDSPPFEPGELFPANDPLAGVCAAETGPEIAAALELPPAPNVIREVEQFIRRFVIFPEHAYLPLAAWIAATYVADVFHVFPYIALVSPVKGCGKTRVLEICNVLCAKAIQVTLPSAAALFRMMGDSPTLLLDEVEALKAKTMSDVSQAILAILNSGYKKGATVPRCEPPQNQVKHFPVYSPKAFAAIGRLPDTLADRSVCITMQRKTNTQKIERFSERRTPIEAEPIRILLAEWAQSQRDTVGAAYENMGDLEFLKDRDAEVWMPLFAVCAVAAPDRVAELKENALALAKTKAADDVEDSFTLKLLADVRSVWPGGAVHVLTVSLLESLKAIPDSPWGDTGHELTPRRLAQMLRPFGPEPRQVRVTTGTGKGYQWPDFAQAFSRYLPALDVKSETSETTRINARENTDSGNETES